MLKKYGRFSSYAKERGWLKYPVPEAGDFFEVYDNSSAGAMTDLSPMYLGPVIDEFGDVLACNIEDAWQGSKVFSKQMVGANWLELWSTSIRFSGKAQRHPFKSKHPALFSYYRNRRWNYTDARQVMYCRWYSKLVRKTSAYQYLRQRVDAGVNLVILDPDGESREQAPTKLQRDSREVLERWINDPKIIFGHGFVLACCLLDIDVWSELPLE